MNFSKPKGTYDVLPKESARWQNIESLIREICSIFNYKEIRTPVSIIVQREKLRMLSQKKLMILKIVVIAR